ncbi:hypothetical protein ABZ801_01035 [Actinomadura sp. NPDC047616]|uniref:hypothetical protein n=1 Tax=Actinomadura sp. NPDC047616 TaxID=3155914 RepID=UPI0033F5C0A1
MERVIYRKGNLERIALTPGDRVRLEHAGWTRHTAPAIDALPADRAPASSTPVAPALSDTTSENADSMESTTARRRRKTTS